MNPLNLLSGFGSKAPRYVVLLLIALGVIFGSHAVVDYAISIFGGECLPIAVDTSLCLVSAD